jgi:PHD-finger
MLCLGIQFNYDWYTGQKLHTVHWRPCFTADMTSKPFIEDWSCQSCGAATNYNFLFPAWLHQSSRLITFTPRSILLTGLAAADSKCFLEKPKGISCERIDSILSCFDVLKRRCIAAIPPDLIPENLSIESTKKSWNLQSKTRSVSIPLLEHIFSEYILEGMDRVSDRAAVQIKKSENIEEQLNAVSLLTEIHYLPPFSKASIASKLIPSLMTSKKPSGFTIPFEESMCPSPRLCLEFIRQRLKNGYYRQTTAMIDDIQEAYVSTVLLVLFKLNHQKFGSTFSIKKFAKSLIKKGSLKSPFLQKGKTSEYTETWKQQPSELFKDEESWTEKIKLVRSLYAMALVSVSETRYIETIFGLLQRKQIKPIPMQVIEKQKSFLAVSEKISHLVSAFSRDPCSNRGQGVAEVQQPLENRLPSVTVKIIMSSNVAKDGLEFPPIIFTPTEYIYFERLSLFFFGKPRRMEACGRCKVVNRSFVGCRVQKGHSNVDFNWDEVMTNVGGVDGLLYSLRTGKPKVLPYTDLAFSSIEKKESDKIEITHDSDSAFDNPYLEMLSEKDKERMQHFEKASRALSLADNLLRKAKDEVDLPLLLSDEFIQNYFPIDPTDGHYNYCTICGLSGDVICCEKCPIVMHRHCAGIVNVPDGDWFCSKCTAKERNVNKILDENLTVEKGTEETTKIEESDVTSQIVDDCQEDPETSVIVNSLPEIRDILPASNTDEKNSFDVATAGEELDLILENLKTTRLLINPPKIKKKDEDEELGQKEHQDASNENAENQGDKLEDNGESEHICLLEVTPESELVTTSNSLGVSEVIVSQQEEMDLPRLRSRQSVDPDSSAKESRSRRLNRNQRSLAETEEDELSIFSPENPEPIGIGSKISKDFGVNGRFLGVVKTLPTEDRPFYYIRYEDGDEEDMDEEELRQVLISIKPPRKRKEKVDIDTPRRKRGRPPKNNPPQS